MNKNLHYYTKDEIIQMMRDEMPFRVSDEILPYLKEAMTIYAKQEAKAYANWLSNEVIAGRTAHKLWMDYEENILKQEL